jgi:hypothetical protein
MTKLNHKNVDLLLRIASLVQTFRMVGGRGTSQDAVSPASAPIHWLQPSWKTFKHLNTFFIQVIKNKFNDTLGKKTLKHEI